MLVKIVSLFEQTTSVKSDQGMMPATKPNT